MRKRGLCCRPVSVCLCLSIRQSDTLVRCIQTAEDILNFLYRPDRTMILVLWPLVPLQNSKGNPFIGGAKYTGWENFAILDRNRRLSRKWYEIGPRLLWNVNTKSYALYRMVTFSMTLTEP